MEDKLVECIQYSLHNYLSSNAIFFAERLHAQLNNSFSLYTLASTLYRIGKINHAYAVIKESINNNLLSLENILPDLRYLFAKCCFDLDKIREAESTLIPTGAGAGAKLVLDDVPSGAAGLYLLGQISIKTYQKKRAIDCFKKCLELNPFMWVAFEALCKLGEDLDPSIAFPISDNEFFDDHSMLMGDGSISSPSFARLASSVSTPHNMFSPMTPHATPMNAALGVPVPTAFTTANHANNEAVMSTPSTPSSNFLITPNQRNPGVVLNHATKMNKKKIDEVTNTKRKVLFQTPESTDKRASSKSTVEKATVEKKQSHKLSIPSLKKKSTTTLNGTKSSTHSSSSRSSTTSNGQTTKHQQPLLSSVQQQSATAQIEEDKENKNEPFTPLPLSFNSMMLEETSDGFTPGITNNNNAEQQKILEHYANAAVLTLLKTIAIAYQHLSFFECNEAITQYQKLPTEHYNTGWILSQIARAHFEMGDYKQAKTVFEQIRKLQPYRTEGMEIYSTILWHMHKEIDLSHLGHELSNFDPRSPESWVVVGNCFSLQKEHDSAIKFFQRSLQIDPNFAYAYTLCGHEYVASDDLEKAMSAFRNAIRLDDRHYNAWAGLGMIFFRQEKYDLAEYHFRKALSINGLSSVLFCYLGMVLHASGKMEESLEMLNNAIQLNPQNNLAKFKHASVLASLGEYEESLSELEKLLHSVPREAPIYFLMGKLCKKLGQPEQALLHFTTAADLDGKNANSVKNAIDKLHLEDLEDDDNFEMSTL